VTGFGLRGVGVLIYFALGSVHFCHDHMIGKRGRTPRYLKLPSDPLLPPGNLTEQLLFPSLLSEYRGSKSLLELRIQKTLKKLRLTHLSHRFHAKNEVSFEEWQSLSNGEKQRIGFARLFLSRDIPSYNFQSAFLDESSFSIDPDMETFIYRECERRSIQLVAIEHRPAVMKYYDYLLQLNLDKSFSFSALERVPEFRHPDVVVLNAAQNPSNRTTETSEAMSMVHFFGILPIFLF
jgi:ABC-type uncharacterized transport system fused permease/ATPase subunit